MPVNAEPEPTLTDITFRVVVTRRVTGRVTPDRKHKWVRALSRFLTVNGQHRATYTVDICEVAGVREVGHHTR